MPLTISPTDPRLTWAGAVSLQTTDEWTMPWRLPFDTRGLFHESLQFVASMPSGVRIAFVSDTTEVVCHVEEQVMDFEAWGQRPVDLLCDGEKVGSESVVGKTEIAFRGIRPGTKVLEIWLPQLWRFRLRSLELSEGATVAPYEDARPKWITYGSSITHCAESEHPSETWPALVARTMGYSLTNFGFGAGCYLEPHVAMLMRDLPADYLSMCVGINIQIEASHSRRTFAQSIIGFVEIVREKHPDVPFVVMSPIISPPRETVPNRVGVSIEMMRDDVAEAVEAMRAHGDAHVHYVDGLTVFGEEDLALMPDNLHPDSEGYRVMAAKFMEKAAKPFFA